MWLCSSILLWCVGDEDDEEEAKCSLFSTLRLHFSLHYSLQTESSNLCVNCFTSKSIKYSACYKAWLLLFPKRSNPPSSLATQQLFSDSVCPKRIPSRFHHVHPPKFFQHYLYVKRWLVRYSKMSLSFIYFPPILAFLSIVFFELLHIY